MERLGQKLLGDQRTRESVRALVQVACKVMAEIVMAYIVMTYEVMARRPTRQGVARGPVQVRVDVCMACV